MQFQSTNYSELFNNSAKTLANRTGISNFGQASKANAILNAILKEENNKTNSLNNILSSLKISSATDNDLDIIGQLFGVQRLEATRSRVFAKEYNFEFYVSTGTFGDINSGNSFTIPANTIVFLESKDSVSGQKVEFRLTTSIVCLNTQSSVFFSAEALDLGQSGNCAAFTVNKHDYSNQSLKVRNNYSIINGRDLENNFSLRNRISKAFTSFSSGNEIALTLAAKSFPGVKDLKFIRNYNGIGSSAIFIDVFEGTASTALLNSIRDKLNIYLSAGEKINIYNPKIVSLTFDLVLKTKEELSDASKTALVNQNISLIRNYFNNYSIGQAIDNTNLYTFIIRNNNNIVQIGRNTGFNQAQKVNAFFYDLENNSLMKTLLTDNLTINNDQKVIIHQVENPITITIEKY